jgi:hypothetical protein
MNLFTRPFLVSKINMTRIFKGVNAPIGATTDLEVVPGPRRQGLQGLTQTAFDGAMLLSLIRKPQKGGSVVLETQQITLKPSPHGCHGRFGMSFDKK